MTIRKRCKEGSCTNGRKCLEHLRFDMMWRGTRYRMPVNDFAIPRMEPGKQHPIQSMEEARDWERVFIGEVKAGRDPSRTPSRSTPVNTQITTVSTFLDAYLERCVKPAGLRSIGSVMSQIAVLKEHLGNVALSGLEDPDEINRFKTDSEYAEDVEIASVHRVLERLRAAMNWGMAQTPPLFTKSPFHRFGVRLNKKAEIARDRRLSREEEKRLLDTALGVMNTAAHRYTGELLHDRIVGALELCCRRGEMLLIQNKRVNRDTCQIGIPGATAKDRENRRIPFNPKGRLAAILQRRGTLGPDAFVFGSVNGEHQPTIQTAWETLKLLANGIEPRSEKEGEAWNRQQLQRIDLRWHDLRHEGACRLHADGVDIRIIQLMLGHASIQQTQRYLNVTDEELRKGLEVSWKNQGRPLRLATGS
jgi:integrase